MSLKITLKPNEKILIGNTVIQNGASKAQFTVLNQSPILREKDIFKEEDVETINEKIYFLVQLIYVDNLNKLKYFNDYFLSVGELVSKDPTMVDCVEKISKFLLEEEYYQALRTAKSLIE